MEVFNSAQDSGRCLDVADRVTGDGADIRSWTCCCKGIMPSCGCHDTNDNYNQVYLLDNSTSPPRVTTGGDKMGKRCLVADKSGVIHTLACSEAKEGSWIVFDATQSPPLRLASDTDLCLSAPEAGAGPSPPPCTLQCSMPFRPRHHARCSVVLVVVCVRERGEGAVVIPEVQ